jgi:hypothetical protein
MIDVLQPMRIKAFTHPRKTDKASYGTVYDCSEIDGGRIYIQLSTSDEMDWQDLGDFLSIAMKHFVDDEFGLLLLMRLYESRKPLGSCQNPGENDE